MGCNSCSSNGEVAGCKNNGGCQTGGCNKMNVFDWLSNMDLPVTARFDIVEVRFKNGRKEFFRNINDLELITGDAVVIDVPNGHHIGHVSLQGELVRLQMKKKKVANDDDIRAVYRIATERDMEKFERTRKREMPTLYRTRQIIDDLKLEMKLTDIEFQADNTKATFYYSADDRVDFRELIKLLASEFKIRVEMRQISLRQEAGRLGGIGSCGRELCCSTWLSEFKAVSTTAARYQNLSLNPSKLSGQCGRLKCCLNYELETYMDALEDIPEINQPLKTEKGEARLQKTDIFRKIMWFGFESESTWYPISVERVNEILKMNAAGELPHSLADDNQEEDDDQSNNIDLERLDKKYMSKGRKKKKRKKRERPASDSDSSGNQPKASDKPDTEAKPSRRRRKGGSGSGNRQQPQNQKQQGAEGGEQKPARKKSPRRGGKRSAPGDNQEGNQPGNEGGKNPEARRKRKPGRNRPKNNGNENKQKGND
ncbi:regulatory iron-sulfur-containing complex subunit RicT [Roseivirga sp. BDSF3-8]|uniref:PSP1 domain-containing protein n=1 Tax=Roseivirga sp. BDSF3-8 TaxID=3241598 RepID=UPI00353244AB